MACAYCPGVNDPDKVSIKVPLSNKPFSVLSEGSSKFVKKSTNNISSPAGEVIRRSVCVFEKLAFGNQPGNPLMSIVLPA